ncbi:Imm1 family immunity protein [Streptomyces sp. NPDC016845]|uniref:Imm1 family immunity protein n=1 Tax=Streptomyces sp. NPDC016845 TaxID=3364972 RepID=UPI0037ADB9F8
MALKVLQEKPLYLMAADTLRDYLDTVFSADGPLVSYVNTSFQLVPDVVDDGISGTASSVPDNVLSVGLDHKSGYGGILWYCDLGLVDKVIEKNGADVANSVWVSLNPKPPVTDPKVLSDPWTPYFFDRVSVLPVSVIRATIEDYFREGTGFRPTRVQWAKGHFTGELFHD